MPGRELRGDGGEQRAHVREVFGRGVALVNELATYRAAFTA